MARMLKEVRVALGKKGGSPVNAGCDRMFV